MVRPSRISGTGVRLSTPEDCDLGFDGCGDAGVPTGSWLRVVITAGGCWWSRSVYRAGPFQRAPLGPPAGHRGGSRAAQDSYFLPVWRHAGGNAAGRGRKREASAVSVHLEPRGPPMLPATTLPAAVPAGQDAAVSAVCARQDAAPQLPAVSRTSWRDHRKTAPRDGDAALAELQAMGSLWRNADGVIEEGPVPPEGIVVIGARPGAYAPGIDVTAAPQ